MIALDAMGGDNAPREVVLGAIQAARKGVAILLLGDQQRIEALLSEFEPNWQELALSIEDCSQEITMAEEPSRAVVRKKDASMVRAMHAVLHGRASAVVSAGNSGAMLAAATLIIGRVPHVLRPALGSFIPTKTAEVFCLDLGATTDCKPEYLEQFALLGSVYVQLTKKIEHPRIGLLSNGAEPYKGSLAVKRTYELLERSPLNFVGNVESRDMFDDTIDVLVCDGFVGNILLKGIQGTARLVAHWLKHEARRNWWSKLYCAFGFWFFRRLQQKSDYSKKGGAVLLGVNHPVLVAHGSSNAFAIEQAIHFAHDLVVTKTIERFNRQLVDCLQVPMQQSYMQEKMAP